MPNSVTLIKGAGGLGRPLDGQDFISGYLHYTTVLPTGFSSSDRIKEIFSVSDAENLGITDTHIGEVKATASLTITGAGTTGNVLTAYVGSTLLGSYTVQAADTVGLVSLGLSTAINAGTSGYTVTGATSANGTQVLVAPAGTGLGANSYTITPTTSGTVSLTYSATFSGGVASQIDVIHYHVKEYFRAQPKGDLFVGIYTNSTDFAEITTMQNFAQGKIRQIGVYKQTAFATAQTADIQTQLELCELNNKPLEAIYQPDFSAVTDLTLLNDLHTLTAENVSVCIGQDGANLGNTLYLATGKSIGTVGITLGAVSLSKVNESIAWINKFNMATTELDTLAFANGTLYTSLSDGTIDNIDNKGYIFLKKHIGISGSYFDNPYTCVPVSSDYARINNNRTINKAIRNLRTFLLPQLASPLVVNSDGTLAQDTISYFETLCQRALDQMIRDIELSAYGVVINPAQNVLSTSTLTVNVSLVPVGTADKIVVNVGFATSVA